MAAITPGFDERVANTLPLSLRIGVVSADVTREISDAVTNAPSLAGFASQGIELLNLRAAFDVGLTMINAETWSAFGHLLETGKLGADLVARLRVASKTTEADLAVAESVRALYRRGPSCVAERGCNCAADPARVADHAGSGEERYVGHCHVVVDPAI